MNLVELVRQQNGKGLTAAERSELIKELGGTPAALAVTSIGEATNCVQGQMVFTDGGPIYVCTAAPDAFLILVTEEP